MLDVSCNGIFFKKDLGIIVNKISPEDVLAEERAEKLIFASMDGAIYKEEGSYEVYSLNIECTITKNLGPEKITAIKEVLKQRNCELILSKKPGFILKARLISQVNFEKLLKNSTTFLLSYEVQPFAQHIEGRQWMNVLNNQSFTNPGNYESKPLIKVDGIGTIIIKYNSKSMLFSKVNKKFIIDTELEDVYGIDDENLNGFLDINSDFITFPIGEFGIIFSGASKVEIMPRWRSL